jgi:hypothetical protein
MRRIIFVLGAYATLTICQSVTALAAEVSRDSLNLNKLLIPIANSYEYCNAKCKPQLMSCTEYTPESQWHICKAQYFQCLEDCK